MKAASLSRSLFYTPLQRGAYPVDLPGPYGTRQNSPAAGTGKLVCPWAVGHGQKSWDERNESVGATRSRDRCVHVWRLTPGGCREGQCGTGCPGRERS